MPLTKPSIEHIALQWFPECGYTFVHGPDIPPGKLAAGLESYESVVLRAIRVTGRCECVGRRTFDKSIHQRRSIV